MGKEKKEIIYRIIIIILLLILICIGGKWGYDKYVEYRAGQLYEDMSQEVSAANDNKPVEPEETEEISDEEDSEEEIYEEETEAEELVAEMDLPDIPAKNLDWDKLKETNSDIYAWIYIPNTKVDYPILQSATDDSYYLNHNIDGSRGYPGCIYTESVNYKDFYDFNTVIYGHNMKSGKMFRTLHDFEDEAFFNENRYVYIYTPEVDYVYEIYAAYDADDSHILNTNDFSTEMGMEAYLDRAKMQAQTGGYYRDDVNVDVNGKIITLSTCTNRSNRRYLLQAIRLN